MSALRFGTFRGREASARRGGRGARGGGCQPRSWKKLSRELLRVKKASVSHGAFLCERPSALRSLGLPSPQETKHLKVRSALLGPDPLGSERSGT